MVALNNDIEMSPAIIRESEVLKAEDSVYPEEAMTCYNIVDEDADHFIKEDLL